MWLLQSQSGPQRAVSKGSLTQRSQHHKHPSHTRDRTDPASPAERRPMTGSLGCCCTRRRWLIVLPRFLVHKCPPRNPFYGRRPSTNSYCNRRLSAIDLRCGRIGTSMSCDGREGASGRRDVATSCNVGGLERRKQKSKGGKGAPMEFSTPHQWQGFSAQARMHQWPRKYFSRF